jgi:hypothetical protein
MFPGFDVDLFRRIADDVNIGAIVIQTYGSGRIPQTTEFIAALRSMTTQRSVVVIIVAESPGELDEFEILKSAGPLLDAGAVLGTDLTAEAAVAKATVLLSADLEYDEVVAEFNRNLAGERTYDVLTESFPAGVAAPCCRVALKKLAGLTYGPHRVLLRFSGLRVRDPFRSAVGIRLAVNRPEESAANEPFGITARIDWLGPENPDRSTFLNIDATNEFLFHSAAGSRSFITIEAIDAHALEWDVLHIFAFFESESRWLP